MNTPPLTHDNLHNDIEAELTALRRDGKITAAVAAGAAIALGAVLGPNLHPNDSCANPDRKDAAMSTPADQSAPEGVTKSSRPTAELGSTITLCDGQLLLSESGEYLGTTVHVDGGGCATDLVKNPGESFTITAEVDTFSCTKTDSFPGFVVLDGSVDLNSIACVKDNDGDTRTGINPPKSPLD